MSEEKKIKKAMKKSTEKKEHKCTCSENGCCSNNVDNSFDTGATIRDVPEAVTPEKFFLTDAENDVAYADLVKTLSMNEIISLLTDYCSTSGKTFDDIIATLATEERRKNEKLFMEMAEKVEEAITSFMQNSTDSYETKNRLLKEMFDKLTSLYLSSTLKNKIDEWKKAQKHTCADIKDKINKCIKENKKDESKVVLKSLKDIFPWMKDEAKEVDRSAPDYEIECEMGDNKDEENDSDSEYLRDFNFPFTYKDEKRNIEINADIIGEPADSIDIQIKTEYKDKNMYITHTNETSYDKNEKLSKFFKDCIESIDDIHKTKKICFNFN